MKSIILAICKQLLRMFFLLFCVSIVTFTLVSASPINPLQQNTGQVALGAMSDEQIEKLEAYWGVNESPVKRFIQWGKAILKGDMGVSLLYRRSVASVLLEKLINSLWIMGFAWLICGGIGFILGIIAGSNRGGKADKIIKSICLFIASSPVFWIALFLLLVFAVWLAWLPIGLSVPIGMESLYVTVFDRIRHAVLPALTLSITGISSMTLHTREKMAEIMDSAYVLYAKARGVSKFKIIQRHGLRNILLPAITLQFASISEIIGGSIVVEQIFSYPGLGQTTVAAGLGGDVSLLMGITLLSAGMVFIGNATASALYRLVDPRISLKRNM